MKREGGSGVLQRIESDKTYFILNMFLQDKHNNLDDSYNMYSDQ